MIGRTVGHYRILERLGGGGMGVVYKAEDTKLGRSVALKFLPPELTRDDEARTRFLHEARAAAHLDHPNICTVYDIGEAEDDRVWIAMACYEGETLRNIIEAGRPPLDMALKVVLQLARGLSKAHSSGIVHRDIKPANVMVTGDGIVKILDFGLAKLEGASQITAVGKAIGTTAYMAPEQLISEEVGPQADIWSLGVVTFELLTGERPFRGEYEQAAIYSILNQDPPSLSSARRDVPGELDRIVGRMLRRSTRERYQSVDEVIDDLTALLEPRSGSDRIIASARQWGRRVIRPALIALGAAVVVIGALAAYMATAGRPAASVASPAAEVRLPPVPQLAVLPFQDISEEPLAPMLGEGFAHAVSAQLGSVTGLQVVSASSRDFERAQSIEAFCRDFGANLVLRGTMQRHGSRIRATWTIVQPDGRQLAGNTAESSTTALFALQDTLGRQVLETLKRPAIAPRKAPPDAEFAQDRYLQALGYMSRYDSQESLDSAIAILETLGDSAGVNAALGRACLNKYLLGGRDPKWAERAQKACMRAAEQGPGDADVHRTLAQLYLATSKIDAAAGELWKAMQLRPNDADALLAYADLCARQERMTDAEAAYKRAIALRPGYWGGHNQLGTFYLRCNRFEAAIAAFERAEKLTPDNVMIPSNIGAAYQYLGRYDDALIAYDRSIRVKPNAAAFANRGALLYYVGRYDEAVDDYKRASAMNPEYFQVWVGLADALRWSTNEKARAPEAYRKAIELAEAELAVRSRDPLIIAMLATCHAKTGNTAKAAEMAKLAVELAPQTAQVNFVAGVAMELAGKRESAVRFIGHALQHGYTEEEVSRDPELSAIVSETDLLTKNKGGA